MDAGADELLALMPFARMIGIELLEAAPGAVRGRLSWAPERCTAGGLLHGGALLSLADSLGGVCAYLNLPPRTATATLGSNTNLLRGVRDGHVEGVARPLHAGRTTIVIETRLTDAQGRLVAVTLQTQAVIASGSGTDPGVRQGRAR